MKNRYRGMMEQVTMSEQGRAELLHKLGETGGAQRGHRTLRTVLAAACACLVLVGGAFAAEHLAGVWLGQVESGEDHSSYQVKADFGQWKLEHLGERLQSDLESGSLRRTFEDKAELEEYLGIELIHSAALESAGIVEDLEAAFQFGFNLRPELATDPNARYVLTGTTVDGEVTDGIPEVLNVSAHRVMENSQIYIDARIVTEQADSVRLEEGLLGEFFEAEPLIDHILSLDEMGRPSWETIHYTSAEKIITSEPYVMDNGTEATIVTVETVDQWVEREKETGRPFEGQGARDYIGYFVKDGVLYSVRPYGVDDPNQSFPNLDSDMLTVLMRVLNTFE